MQGAPSSFFSPSVCFLGHWVKQVSNHHPSHPTDRRGALPNITSLLARYGIGANNDCVISPLVGRYTHPKEVAVADAVLSTDALRAMQHHVSGSARPESGRMTSSVRAHHTQVTTHKNA